MAKPSRQHVKWIEQWMRGGLGSIDQRIRELNEELTHLDTVRKALEPLAAVVATPAADDAWQKAKAEAKAKRARIGSKTKRKARKPKRMGPLMTKVLNVLLVENSLTAPDIARQLKMKKLEGVYAPLYALERNGLARRDTTGGQQYWFKVKG